MIQARVEELSRRQSLIKILTFLQHFEYFAVSARIQPRHRT